MECGSSYIVVLRFSGHNTFLNAILFNEIFSNTRWFAGITARFWRNGEFYISPGPLTRRPGLFTTPGCQKECLALLEQGIPGTLLDYMIPACILPGIFHASRLFSGQDFSDARCGPE
jgi:hypothetical protein